jgi:dolichyl-phosphate beta-glucosyltransferase
MISIIIAAYNEENRIAPSLSRISKYCFTSQLDSEIIVVDDGSGDRTVEVVNELRDIPNLRVISYRPNMGKGYALRKGVLLSKGDIILLTDADLSTPIEELSKLLPLIFAEKNDIAIGSRSLTQSQIIKKQVFWRQGMGKIFNKIVKLLVINDFKDTQCGFKLFSRDAATCLFKEARINRFAYDVEILALAKRRGYRISEVPVRWINSPESKVKPLRDSAQMFFDLLRIRATIGYAKEID